MYEKVRARIVRVHRNDLDDYETGLLFIATLVYGMVVRNYFSYRLDERLPKEVYSWPETYEEQEAFESSRALTAVNRSGFRILCENKKKSWNFFRLYVGINKKIPVEESALLKEKTENFIEKIRFYKDYVDKYEAHLSKDIDPNALYAFPSEDEYLLDAINLLDEFVDGEIEYLYKIDGEDIDLKNALLEITIER